MIDVKFSGISDSEFSVVLKKRVNDYFAKNNLSKYGNRSMVIKSVVMLTLFILPLVIINTGIVTKPILLFASYIVSGLGMAGIGMGVMHDAIHGSYSNNRTLNKYMSYTMNLIGANATVWKVQHNVLHHTYTNIDKADDDLNTPFFLRFSPHAKWYWVHKFQFLYVWFFYGLSTISWITTKDFMSIYRYRKMGFFKKKNEFRTELLKLIIWKAVYYSFALILPMAMVPLAPQVVVSAFLAMHFVTGLSISIIFQTAHVMPDTDFKQTDEQGVISSDWSTHQLSTTTNFAPKGRLFSWLIGGLNYQVEHHLMPNVCHVHYRKLAPIVKRTANEFGIPYLSKKTFAMALIGHMKMLYQLGRKNTAYSN